MSIKSIQRFLQNDIWRLQENSLPFVQRIGVQLLKRIIITCDMFVTNNLASFTAALTYSCILAAVPVLSIIFAIARGFGFDNIIEERLQENIKMSPEITETVMTFINSYLERTRGGIFVGVGLIMLLYTVVMLTSNIEKAFNTIWHVQSSRNIYRTISDYVSIFLVLPIIIVVTSGFSIFMVTLSSAFSDYVVLSNTMSFVINVVPILIAGLSFTILYKFMPNTHVRWRATLIPGMLAGTLFQFVQYIYIHYQIVLSSYNAIYGSFAALPMFMLWLQISWYICLIGGQLSYANQCTNEYSFAKDSQNISRREHDNLALLIMSRICKRYADGTPPHTAMSLANDTNIPLSMVNGLLTELMSAGILCEVRNETGTRTHYLPSQDIHTMTVDWLIQQLDANATGRLGHRWAADNREWEDIRKIRATLTTKDGDTPIMNL